MKADEDSDDEESNSSDDDTDTADTDDDELFRKNYIERGTYSIKLTNHTISLAACIRESVLMSHSQATHQTLHRVHEVAALPT